MRKEVSEEIGGVVDAAGWSGVELEGEIYLEKSLLPSFAFPVMSVEVSFYQTPSFLSNESRYPVLRPNSSVCPIPFHCAILRE